MFLLALTGLISLRVGAVDPQPAPPAIRLSPGLAEAPLAKRLETVGAGVVAPWREYSIGDPTSEEQMYLEYINRARALPWEEGYLLATRSEERRVGKECLRLCRSRWSPYH